MLFAEILKETLEYYQSLVDHYHFVVGISPEGHLRRQNNRGWDQYLHIMQKDGVRIRRGINRDPDMIRALAQKEFALAALDVLRADTQLLENALNHLIPFDPDEILQKMGKAYGRLPEEYFFERGALRIEMNLEGADRERIDRHQAFADEWYDESNYYQEFKRTRTSRGQLVRSKSEALILERLYSREIGVHYDRRIVLNGKLLVPDFTFEGADGQLIFWEHLGMMSKPDYAETNLEKIRKYTRAGVIPGKNLILTFDGDDSIDVRMMDAVIETQLIPYL